MTKTYYNNALVGNSSMLGCFDDRGELVRLFWPNIDYSQHIERLLAGIFFMNQTNSTLWLNDDCFAHSQRYAGDTNILETVCENSQRGLRAVQIDYVLPGKDILTRSYEIENIAGYDMDIGFVVYFSGVTANTDLGGVLFDFGSDEFIYYRHGYYISISGDCEVYQFQLGNNALEAAKYGQLNGYDNIGMMSNGAVSWKLGTLRKGEKQKITFSICASHTLKGVKELASLARKTDPIKKYDDTAAYWTEFIDNARHIHTGRSDIDSLYKRSLLVFKLLADEKTGGLLASAEIDENFTRCGRYGYCWGRDAAFITSALDRCGLHSVVDSFYKWALKTQEVDGSWQQRYYTDGNLAPSWGLQIDETGALLWGMLKHYEETGSRSFLEEMWEGLKKGISFLIEFTDADTGLPKPSYDLWEERVGEHTYSSAAVYGGIMAGVAAAEILGISGEFVCRWREAAGKLKGAMEKSLWKSELNRFLRSVRTKLNPWGSEYSSDKTVIKVNPKGYYRDVTLEDGTVDVSLLGISIPFDVFNRDDLRVKGTVEAIEKNLTVYGTGGIKRYENDNYIGGNPWVLATLWVALYHIRGRNFDKALNYLEWAVKARTGLDFLPEQVDRESGKPAWVIPLTWSHAMFVLVLAELVDAGVFDVKNEN